MRYAEVALGAPTMPRLHGLFRELRTKFPDDWYLKGLDLSLESLPQARSVIATYERALDTLDVQSWETLRGKAIEKFLNDDRDRGKQQFFNQLNEAFAYRFLLQRDCQQVTFIPEDKKRETPDIGFMRNDSPAYCEVKTFSVSQEEIGRAKSGDIFDSSIYQQLSPQFLETKLSCALRKALAQISSYGTDGFVYIIAHFDDFTLAYYSTYRRQIMDFLSAQFPTQEVYMRIGLQGRKHLHHYPYCGNA